jgi:hypothetical protein
VAVSGDVRVALHDIQRTLAACRDGLVGGTGSKPIDRNDPESNPAASHLAANLGRNTK